MTSWISVTFLVLLLVTEMTSALKSKWHRTGFASESSPPRCLHLEEQIWKSQDTIKVTSDVRGAWVSQSCEVRPGPEYVLRRYHFLDKGHFRLLQWYFLDPDCSTPTFGIEVYGSHLAPPRKSWVVPGSYEGEYALRRVTIVPYSKDGADIWGDKANNRSCSNTIPSLWRQHRKYRILSFHSSGNADGDAGDFDCTDAFSLSFNELQLLRVEHRNLALSGFSHPPHYHHRKKHKWLTSELFLGAQDPESEGNDRPTHYQSPLLHAQMADSAIGRSVSKSTLLSPPRLPVELRPALHLSGAWISLRCEVRLYGFFLRRRFHFDDFNGQWSADHHYFRDPNCRKPLFDLKAGGHFKIGHPSLQLLGATEINFFLTRAALTPRDYSTLGNLNEGKGCGDAPWEVGTTQDLTSSGGCDALHISVPKVEFDVTRMDIQDSNLLLFLGETIGHGSRRPTTFQPPMMRCSSSLVMDNTLHPMPYIFLPMRGSASHGTSPVWTFLVFATLISLFHDGKRNSI